ncbi:hypothetical protein LTR37_000419 [Vermiconidia calcicola]|uniref:Uncharacterized protein n=1 Tax=Vermiconidia calcicola TaxID=1690605 RepID=A0ACC3P0B9_9PEZI|nr:hypothetical protein LTR37_000419 [Vermiconidia calcicola]
MRIHNPLGFEAEGTICLDTRLVVVRWEYIVAHVIFIVLSLLLLLGTMMLQRSSALRAAGAWKSSSLAVTHALDPELQSQLYGIRANSLLVDQDERQMIPKSGWRLVPKANSEIPLQDI